MKLFSGLFKLGGIVLMGYGMFVIIKWYTLWISYYFIGSIKPSIIIGLLTFFLSPIAGIVDLFWHSFQKTTIEMWIYFLVFFICGRIVFFIGDLLSKKQM